ncbi:hypothetical protein SAMN05444422_101750 [Halobiforma haloterrestris]|uniref:Uncharacterized protein n=1 Tax=Natronobacterium haloterrestre TaxID=148448 RepID=A0A1I1DLV9_NATHA|nr:hypothetical protein SAMN05444422_101750 [Halobiforma haloterrestris]
MIAHALYAARNPTTVGGETDVAPIESATRATAGNRIVSQNAIARTGGRTDSLTADATRRAAGRA